MNKILNRKENTEHPDFIYINPWFDELTEAILKVKSGMLVVLFFEKDLERSDLFQHTKTFPSNVFDFLHQLHEMPVLKRIFDLAPHLVQNQKVFYADSSISNGIWRILADAFFKNQGTKKSELINRDFANELSFLEKKTLKGLLFHEYKININRLFIELLKFFESMGGRVETNVLQYKNSSHKIRCKRITRNIYKTSIKIPSHFFMVFQNKGAIIRLFEKNAQLHIELFNAKARSLSKSAILALVLKKVSFPVNDMRSVEYNEILSLETLKNILKAVDTPLACTFENSSIKENYELALEKFDLAKQTGITYEEFKILFHRYGAAIDDMIEQAYHKMEQTRDSQKIWEMVEEDFQKKYEWKRENYLFDFE